MSGTSQKIAVFKQPKPFYVVFFIEFWERFGFYGMQVILTFYFVEKLGLTEAQSYNLYSAFTALLYALTSIGGYIGDHILGTKRTMLLGAVFLAVGYFMLGFPDQTFTALGVICVGNGLFKANPSSLLSKCYDANDPRLDGAFTMYYMSINIGSFISMSLVPIVTTHFGWGWGFWTVSLGLVLGILNYLLLAKWVKHVGSPAGKKALSSVKFLTVLLGAVLAIFACAWILHHLTFAHWLLTVVGIAVAALFIWQICKAPKAERPKMVVALVLMLEAIAFFVLYQQMPTSLNFFAINNVHHGFFGISVDPKSFQALNPLWIMILSPLLAYGYGVLGRNKKDLTMPSKFVLGMFLCALGFLSLYISTYFADSQGIVSSWWMVVSYFFQSAGELLVSGLGLAMVARLVPQRIMGFLMGAWFMVTAIAMVLGGFVASLTSVPAHLTDHNVSLHVYGKVFLGIGVATGLVMLIMWALVPFLKRRML